MKIDLNTYMQDRGDVLEADPVAVGPVVTLSREFGCKANHLAIKLISMIAQHQDKSVNNCSWRYINKEIIEESARNLGITSAQIERTLIGEEAGGLADIFRSLSSHYAMTDKKMTDTVKEVIDTYARKGNVIVVGRGGTALTQNIPSALHVRLMAPIAWRTERLVAERNTDIRETRKLIKEVDEKRRKWSETLSGRPYEDGLFHIILNSRILTEEEMALVIFDLMVEKGMI